MLILRKRIFRNHFPADQMFLNDALENFRRAGMVPHPFRVNQGNRSAHANAQTIRFRSINHRIRPRQTQLLQARFQKLPRPQTHLAVAAFRFRLVGAKKDMPAVFAKPERFPTFEQFIHFIFLHPQRFIRNRIF